MPKSNFLCDISDDCSLITLCAPNNCTVNILPLGACVGAVYTKDRDGNIKNIAFPSQDPQDYAGATLGPVAGRISGAILPINGKNFALSANENGNTLHGGAHNLSHELWQIHSKGVSKHGAFVELHCDAADGVDGFPGNRRFAALFTLSQRALTVCYRAYSDKPTFVNMSSHIYWNLGADFEKNCYDQNLELAADAVLYNDALHLPFLLEKTDATAFDFTVPISIKDAMQRAKGNGLCTDAGQLSNARGYNNAFALRQNSPFAARLTHLASGRRLTINTNSRYLCMYSGGYLPVCGAALALEPQSRPSTFTPILYPRQIYRQSIRFTFDCV